jgi:FkbM family methyltransferase
MTMAGDALPNVYRTLMALTRHRGALTLGKINAKFFARGQRIRLIEGSQFFLPPDPHFIGYLLGHEKHITTFITAHVEEGDVCLDIGANIGYFAVQLAAACGPNGLVYAYEPDRTNFAWLEKNCSIARSRGLNITPVQAAASDTSGYLRVVKGRESTMHRVDRLRAEESLDAKVPSVVIDSELERLGIAARLKLIKIDVEGFEPHVLKGLTNTVCRRLVKYIIMEVQPGEHARAVDSIVSGWGDSVLKTLCWIDNSWQPISPSKLTHQTDALLELQI